MTALERQQSKSAGGCARTEAKPSNKTFTPSDRDIRPKRRTKRIEEQAADAKLATELAIGSMIVIIMRKNLMNSLIL